MPPPDQLPCRLTRRELETRRGPEDDLRAQLADAVERLDDCRADLHRLGYRILDRGLHEEEAAFDLDEGGEQSGRPLNSSAAVLTFLNHLNDEELPALARTLELIANAMYRSRSAAGDGRDSGASE